MKLLTRADDIDEVLNEKFDKIKNAMSEFQLRDSGWSLFNITKIYINLYKAKLTRGSSFIETPKKLGKKNACLNIKNINDPFCFKWCLIAALGNKKTGNTLSAGAGVINGVPTTDKDSPRSYENVDINEDTFEFANGIRISFKKLEFPTALHQIKNFERINADISINVFGFEDGEVVGPYYLTKEEKVHHVNLILLYEDGRFHYILVKDTSR